MQGKVTWAIVFLSASVSYTHLTHSGADLFGTGYWAEKDKSITYRFALPAGTYTAYAGFSEWWTASRQAPVSYTHL